MASPDEVRNSLALVAAGAAAEIQAASRTAQTPEELRAALFLAAPIVAQDYTDGAAALALDWYEDLRRLAAPRKRFDPEPATSLSEELVKGIVVSATASIVEDDDEGFAGIAANSIRLVSERVGELAADGFRDTVTNNTKRDPGAVGWRRFARPGACKFCLMLADKGAVFTKETARFAAHGAVMGGTRKGGNCMCVAGPAFSSETWTEATPLQYVASKRLRTPGEKQKLREYLSENFPDAPG